MIPSKKTYLFYEDGLLKTGLSGLSYRGIFRHQTQLLAEVSITDEAQILLPLVDQKHSVEGAHIDSTTRAFAYTPFGHNPETPKDTLLAFNGEPCERFSQLYLLGQGYRAFNTRLMRFHSPDSLSPFAPYCTNSYAYCLGDPINFSDPSGHMPKATKGRAPKYGSHSTNPIRPPHPTHSPSPANPANPVSPASPINYTSPIGNLYLEKTVERLVRPRKLEIAYSANINRLFAHIPGPLNPDFQTVLDRPVAPFPPTPNDALIDRMFAHIPGSSHVDKRATDRAHMSKSVTQIRNQ
ncbi:RHS repeat-associated core domain-containing protein [Pseudomonas sp. UBA6562]|uniref:RHS repeat-associated core domain-containing protein n=1 Tax=Pseudomonas sp. UBA6562 TaxID=1947332 RepID=UPI0025EB1EE4|nr:RHS repeat-associated core domain-containing protein [Pseudomonas sp. UBA6562]